MWLIKLPWESQIQFFDAINLFDTFKIKALWHIGSVCSDWPWSYSTCENGKLSKSFTKA